MAFSDEYKDVEAHGNTKLHAIHTNDKKQMAISLTFPVFNNFLTDPRYTFAGFFVDSDKTRLECVNLEVANFLDIQNESKVPEATKELDSLGDVSRMLIDDYYNNRHWATLPLSMRHVEYAAKDAYAAYEIWNRITLTQDGLHRA
ncbi:hypothetical protein VPH35_122431 [Triticum aestivum]